MISHSEDSFTATSVTDLPLADKDVSSAYMSI